MIELFNSGAYLINGSEIIRDDAETSAKLKQRGISVSKEQARKGTISHGILSAHNTSKDERILQRSFPRNLTLKFDSLTSHDITYVGIIQTARASGMERFPVPYVLTNCHNSLCAVGGTINQDDHVFALSAARKYGGIYVPPHLAVIHSYNREMMAGCGKMILGSDSHTRYGALGTMAVGEGGGELAKQLVGRTYDMANPEVVGIFLSGEPAKGVGPQDVALAIIKAVFSNGYVKNKVMEFTGDGVAKLSVDFRNGIDVMTTETTCWSSIWKTDDQVKTYLDEHGRGSEYRELKPADAAYYDGFISICLSKIEPCIALPFHPSNVYTIKELQQNAKDILAFCNEVSRAKNEEDGLKALGVRDTSLNLGLKYHDGGVWADQAVIAGCSGGIFSNIMAAVDIMKGASIGNSNFSMSVYPESQPVYLELVKNGAVETLMKSGVLVREAFCGPCFGAGDTPANGELSIRHVTSNFPNREGSKPTDGQIASVALMDARSIAATAANGGRITSATDIDIPFGKYRFVFDRSIYDKRVYNGTGAPLSETKLVFGPNIKDWPKMPALPENLLLKVVSFITDPVTTTDELIPSGETSSYRSNPLKLAEFTLSRKDPGYVERAKNVQTLEQLRHDGKADEEMPGLLNTIRKIPGCEKLELSDFSLGSAIFARKPGDGSAREQAASCQRVLGASANFALEYATKRYRSNLINWGILPFIITDEKVISTGSYIFFPGLKDALLQKKETITGFVLGDTITEIKVSLGELTDSERQILINGCLINYYAHFATKFPVHFATKFPAH
ncbi:MAG: hydratase [Treponema sp.]|jgi:aconitate hydratase|nr:hydratase [Treponema sp.]